MLLGIYQSYFLNVISFSRLVFRDDWPMKLIDLDSLLLFSAELKPRGYYLELFWQAELGYIGKPMIEVKVPNSSHVASIQHWRVFIWKVF